MYYKKIKIKNTIKRGYPTLFYLLPHPFLFIHNCHSFLWIVTHFFKLSLISLNCHSFLCIALCCTVLHCIALCCTVLHSVALCCTVLHSVALCCTVLHSVALCCTLLHCNAVCCRVCLSVCHRDCLYM